MDRIKALPLRSKLLIIFTGGLLARLALLPVGISHNSFDRALWREWAVRMSEGGVGGFYSNLFSQPFENVAKFNYLITSPERLPTDVWALRFLVGIYEGLGGSAYGPVWDALVFSVAILGDCACYFLIYSLLKRLTGSSSISLLTASLFFLSPFIILVSADHGTWDSLALALALAAWRVLLIPRWWGPPAAGLFALLAVLDRPHSIFILLAAGLVWLALEKDLRRVLMSLASGSAAVFLTALALCAPLGVGVLWAGENGSLPDRVSYAFSSWKMVNHSAANVWSFAPDWAAPISDGVYGLPVYPPAIILFFLAMAGGFLAWRRWGASMGVERSLYLMALCAFSWFLFFPRMLDRYCFGAMVLLILLYGVTRTRGMLAVVIAAHLLALANLLVITFVYPNPEPLARLVALGFLVSLTALLILPHQKLGERSDAS